MWHDKDPIWLVNKFYSCYMDTVVIIVKGGGKGGAMGLKLYINWIRWGLAPPQLYTTFCVAEPPDLDAVLFYVPIHV